MIAAANPRIAASAVRLLTVDALGHVGHTRRDALARLLRHGDVVVANDAATIPASLRGTHEPTGRMVEVRLAARDSLLPHTIDRVVAVVFGEGDFHTRTEDRPQPPVLHAGDRLALGPLRASVLALRDHPRLVSLGFEGSADRIWEGLARHGRPVQYAHVPESLHVWDTWTAIAGPAVAFEPPSAGFALTWSMVKAFEERGIRFVTLTHAAGLSSTGDAALDRRLPFDEAYDIPRLTARTVNRARARGRRIVAVGTSVVRALEHAGRSGIVRHGQGLATQRIGAGTALRVVDVLVSGTHEPGTSHYELLRAFLPDEVLTEVDAELNRLEYRTHEFGDAVLVERALRVSTDVMAGDPGVDAVRGVLRGSAP